MSRKHFIEIAATIKALQATGGDVATLRAVAGELATTFKKLNPNFDRARFLAACGF
jgi:hypothetical protein